MVCLALCLLTVLGAVWVQAEAAASLPITFSTSGTTYQYAQSGEDLTSLTYGTKTRQKTEGSASATLNTDGGITVSLSTDYNKNFKLCYKEIPVTIKVPAKTTYSVVFSTDLNGTFKRASKKATAKYRYQFVYLGENSAAASGVAVEFCMQGRFDADGNALPRTLVNGQEVTKERYCIIYPSGGNKIEAEQTYNAGVREFSDDFVNNTNATKSITRYFGFWVACGYGSTYKNQGTANLTITPKVSYTVNFNPNGGTVSPTSQTVTVGKTYGDLLPTPTRTGGYTFDGWYTAKTGGTKITSSSTVTTSVGDTLYAHWYLTPAIPASDVHCREEATLTYGDYTTLGLTIHGQPKHTNSQEWYECDKDGNNGKLLTDKNGKPRKSIILPTAGVHYYYAVAITTRTDNGLSARVKSNVAKVTVEKATPRWNGNPDATNIDIAKDPYLKASTLTGGDMRTSIYYDVGGDSSAVVPGHFEWVNGETKLTKRGKSYHKVRFVPDDTQNYNVVDIQYSVTVTAICSHIWGDWEEVKKPTCTANGQNKHTCTVCNEIEKESVNVLGHDWGAWTVSKAASCTEKGEEMRTCQRSSCAGKETRATEALGHDLIQHTAKAATCTETGWEAYEACSRCDYTTKVGVPAKGHTEVIDAAVEPTCTEKGKTEGKHCSVCETVLVAQTEVPARGHNWGDWVITTPATENAEGVETRTCQNDASHTETRAIPKLGHTHSYTEKDAAEEYLAKAATCTEKAKYYYSCTCGEKDTTRTFESGMALGHNWGAWAVSKAASCTEKGEEARPCQRDGCTAKETRDVKALGHDYAAGFTVDTPATCTAEGSKSKHCSRCDAKTGETVVPALGHDLIRHEAKAATCTEAGWKAHETCSRCDYTTKVEIDKLGHNWGAWTVTKAASCTKKGEEARTCQRDGCAGKETRAIEALGHTEVIDAAVAATCTEKGLTAGKHCAVCSEVLVRQTKTPALHHDWSHWNVTTPATAETEGEEIRTCRRDASHTESRAVPKLGHIHDWVEVSEVPATCIEIGEAAHYECEDCGHMALAEGAGVYMEITDETTLTIPVSDEDHVPDAAVQEKVVPATCTEKGSCDEAVYCKECGKELSRNTKVLDELGHDYSVKEHDENEHWNKCSRCASTDAKAPHEWNNGEETTKPTCMTPGVKTYTCTACGRTKAETLSALGHDIVSHEAKAATCTEAGWNAYVACSRCDYTTKVEIPATGHSWGEWIVTTPATTEAEGVETRTCQQDTNHFETRAIPKLTPQPPQPERPEDPIPAQHPVNRRFPAKTDAVTDEKMVKSSDTGDVGVAIYVLSALLSAGGAAWMGRQKKRGE